MAGDYKQFQDWLKEKAENFEDFDARQYRYADSPEDINGLIIEGVVTIGTWYERDANHELLKIAQTRII